MQTKTNQKIILEVIVKSIIFAICAGALVTLTHMLSDIFIFHHHGKPEFVSTTLTTYSACDKILMAIGYYILGRKLPIKNPVLRSMTYIGLNWISNFLPQFMGLACADGPIAEQAFRISDLVCDTITMLVLGILLGLLYKNVPNHSLRNCNKKTFIKAIVTSAVTFPIFVTIIDQLMYIVHPAFSSSHVISVSEQARTPFLINFYSWFFLTGIFISVFYRFTEYNAFGKWYSFGLKYSLLLWSPVVMIMAVFGTAVLPTIIYTLFFIIIIMMISLINYKILEKQAIN